MCFHYSEAQVARFKRIRSSCSLLVRSFKCILSRHLIHLFRDVSSIQTGNPLKLLGIISAHTRPVQCLSAEAHSEHTATFFTADSMGLIKVWALERTYGETPSCRASLKEEWSYHRTGISDIWYGQGQLWTGRWLAARSSRKIVEKSLMEFPSVSIG